MAEATAAPPEELKPEDEAAAAQASAEAAPAEGASADAAPAAPEPLAPIIVKKVMDDGHGGAHGGAWKIALADMMTAMMPSSC
jgi:chemotaxis protein MotB